MGRYIGISLVIFGILVCLFFVLHATITLSVFNNFDLKIIRLMIPLTEFTFMLPGCFSLYFLYTSISNIALSANVVLLRILSTLAVIGIIIISILGRVPDPVLYPDALLGVVLRGMNMGLAVGLLLMLTVLLRLQYFGRRLRQLPEEA